jgi:predicted kinase
MNKGKLIILVGISNSGKSTYASTLVQSNPSDYIRVNRDDIRSLLYGYNDETVYKYYERDDVRFLEKQVTRFEDTLIYDSLELGKTVIVDATHLTRAYIERFKYWNVETRIKIFDVTIEEAMVRDSLRSRKVNEDIINKQFKQYKSLVHSLEKDPIDFTPVKLDLGKLDRKQAIIFDIDGTLAEKNDRNAFDWSKVRNDDEIAGVCSINRLLARGIKHIAKYYGGSIAPKIIIATGRDGVCLDDTELWLEDMEIEYDEIYIRPKGDMRPDWLIKQEMAQAILKDHNILGWFDDRLQVTRHLRMLGLEVYNVAHGNF